MNLSGPSALGTKRRTVCLRPPFCVVSCRGSRRSSQNRNSQTHVEALAAVARHGRGLGQRPLQWPNRGDRTRGAAGAWVNTEGVARGGLLARHIHGHQLPGAGTLRDRLPAYSPGNLLALLELDHVGVPAAGVNVKRILPSGLPFAAMSVGMPGAQPAPSCSRSAADRPNQIRSRVPAGGTDVTGGGRNLLGRGSPPAPGE